MSRTLARHSLAAFLKGSHAPFEHHFFLGLGWSSTAGAGPISLPPPSARIGITYEADIRPIFEASCFRCHGEKRRKGDLRLDSLEAVLKGGEQGSIVVSGNSAKSLLVIAIGRLDKDSAMPPIRKGGPTAGGPPGTLPPPKPLTPEEVGLVRAWIDQGVK